MHARQSWFRILGDLVHFLCLGLRSRTSLAAENLFLRKQLAFYQERKGQAPTCRRSDAPDSDGAQPLVQLARCFDRREAQDLCRLAPQGLLPVLALEVRSWPATDPSRAPTYDSKNGAREPLVGEERIANELLLKLGLRVSPRTIRKYMPKLPAAPPGGPRGDQRWAVILRDHARFIIACDFCIVVTAAFRVLYVFLVVEHASRRLIHLRPNRPPGSSPTRSRSLGCQREDRRHAPVLSPLSDNGTRESFVTMISSTTPALSILAPATMVSPASWETSADSPRMAPRPARSTYRCSCAG
jgi:putative transposase